MRYYKNFELTEFNSFRLNSIAKEIWFPQSIDDLKYILKDLKDKNFFILAGGTNVILKPEIDRIICLKLMPKYLKLAHDSGVIVSANYSTASFILNAVEADITGLEGLYGIPGTIGGAIVMNAGSGKYTISDYLLAVTTIDFESNFHIYKKEDLKFSRRYSLLQDKNEILIDAIFDLKDGKPDLIELEKAKQHRKSLPKFPSAGGIFKNWHELKPYFYKLIGLRIGDAEISEKINIIINKANATYYDITQLINKIRSITLENLELEVKIIG